MAEKIDLEQILDMAVAQQEAGQSELAEAGYRTVLQYDPNEPDALNLLGVILQERGKFDEAIALTSRAPEIEPDFPEALTNLARAQRGVGAPAAAVDAARRAVALDPIWPRRTFNWGALWLNWRIMRGRPQHCAKRWPWLRNRWMPCCGSAPPCCKCMISRLPQTF